MTQFDPMLAQDKDKPLNQGFVCNKHKIGYIGQCPTCAFEKDLKAEEDSLIGWLERRLEHASSRTIPMYVGAFQDMWAKQFGTLEGIPQELKNHTNALYQQRKAGET